jgi:hypothetical protein
VPYQFGDAPTAFSTEDDTPPSVFGVTERAKTSNKAREDQLSSRP